VGVEAAQDGLGGGGAEPDGRGVLHHQVVLLLDQLPPDRVGQRGPQPGVAVQVARGREVELAPVDLLDPRQQVESQEPRDPEPYEALYVDKWVSPATLEALRQK